MKKIVKKLNVIEIEEEHVKEKLEYNVQCANEDAEVWNVFPAKKWLLY